MSDETPRSEAPTCPSGPLALLTASVLARLATSERRALSEQFITPLLGSCFVVLWKRIGLAEHEISALLLRATEPKDAEGRDPSLPWDAIHDMLADRLGFERVEQAGIDIAACADIASFVIDRGRRAGLEEELLADLVRMSCLMLGTMVPSMERHSIELTREAFLRDHQRGHDAS